MLDIINIHKTFNKGTINEKVALDGVTLHLNEGDFCTIIGGNGAGKSTPLNAVAGVLSATIIPRSSLSGTVYPPICPAEI